MIKLVIPLLLAIIVVGVGIPLLDAATVGSLDDYIYEVRAAGYAVYAQGEDNLQAIYENSSNPELFLTPGVGGLTIRDTADGLGGNLFEVQNYPGNTTYLSVNSTDVVLAGVLTVEGIGDGGLSSFDLKVGDTETPDYGMIQVGDTTIGRTSYNIANVDLDGAFIFRNQGGPKTGIIEFLWEEGSGATRFAIPTSGIGNATYNPRSMIIAGPAPADTDMVTVGYWQTNNNIFDNLVADTNGDGADLGVQNDLEVEGDIFTDSIKESTIDAGITLEGDIYSVAWADYGGTSEVVGFSGSPTVNVWYKKIGNLVLVNFYISGVSNATNFTFTLPYTQVATGINARVAVYGTDNGTTLERANVALSGTGNTTTIYPDWNASTWTSSGAKAAEGQFWYEAQ